ncbi:MAG TPA: hypothetical protein VIR54_32525 [Vicinamibacterales bacterium]
MTAPKKPQDHLEKVVKPKIEPVDGGRKVTLDGVTVTVMDDALDDFELLDDLGELQRDKKQAARLPRILRQLVGDDSYHVVMDGLRGTNGRVSVTAASEWIKKLFEAINPNS